MTKQGIEYLRGIYANVVRGAHEHAEGRMAGNIGRAMAEEGCKEQAYLVEAIAQIERFKLPTHEEIFKESPNE